MGTRNTGILRGFGWIIVVISLFPIGGISAGERAPKRAKPKPSAASYATLAEWHAAHPEWEQKGRSLFAPQSHLSYSPTQLRASLRSLASIPPAGAADLTRLDIGYTDDEDMLDNDMMAAFAGFPSLEDFGFSYFPKLAAGLGKFADVTMVRINVEKANRRDLKKLLQTLAELPRLRRLQFYGWNKTVTLMTDADLADLASSMPDLTYLTFYAGGVTGKGLSELAGLKSLDYLQLRDAARLTNDDIKILAGLPALKTLEIDGGAKQLTAACLEHFKDTPSLKTVLFVNTSEAPKAAVEKFVKENPAFRLRWF